MTTPCERRMHHPPRTVGSSIGVLAVGEWSRQWQSEFEKGCLILELLVDVISLLSLNLKRVV